MHLHPLNGPNPARNLARVGFGQISEKWLNSGFDGVEIRYNPKSDGLNDHIKRVFIVVRRNTNLKSYSFFTLTTTNTETHYCWTATTALLIDCF